MLRKKLLIIENKAAKIRECLSVLESLINTASELKKFEK